MFTIIRLLTGIAILVFVGFSFNNVKNRLANHEENPFQAPSIGSVASGVFGGLKDHIASRKDGGGNSGGGFFGSWANGNDNTRDNYRGGYLKSRPEVAGKSMAETACDYYPDQCANERLNRQDRRDRQEQ